MGRLPFWIAPLAAALLAAPVALGSDWLPHSKHATWTYSWRDTRYAPAPTKEKVTVKEDKGDSFVLAWTTDGIGNPTGATGSTGTVSFEDTSLGLVNTNWASSPPPPTFPVLCTQAASCGNSLASVYYNVIWGTRSPTLAEPLVRGTSWSTTGGSQNDVAGSSDYLGTATVSVPAFGSPVRAAVVRTEVSQVGAIGDPYGTGVRTVWWVYGVGPVKVLFQHAGGAGAPVTTAELVSTSLKPQAPPPDVDYFPLRVGLSGRFRWTNSRLFDKPEVQSFKVDQAVNGSARLSIQSVSGPIKAKGAYFYTRRADGLSNLAGSASAATLAKLPPLGPASLPADKRRHFFTVFDLMDFGFNPILPPDPVAGTTWSAKAGTRDFDVYGAHGTSRLVGVQRVTVPAGTYDAVVVRTDLRQPGFPWGSGVRTSWFAPGEGLVKLEFRHGDGSVSEVVRLA